MKRNSGFSCTADDKLFSVMFKLFHTRHLVHKDVSVVANDSSGTDQPLFAGGKSVPDPPDAQCGIRPQNPPTLTQQCRHGRFRVQTHTLVTTLSHPVP